MTPPMTRRRSERGAVAVELALVVPLLLLLLAGVYDLGMALMTRAQMQEAVEEAAVAAARDPADPAAARQNAVDAVSVVTIAPGDVTIACENSARRVRVNIDHVYDTLLLGLISFDDIGIAVSMVSDVLSETDCSPSP
jgi:Flp pilus assembly protein TadG